MPRHVNPNKKCRTAHAPYNFVPLPEAVFIVEEGIEVENTRIKPWEQQDRYVPSTKSGWIELEIEALTPLFIRGAVRRNDSGQWDAREVRRRPDAYQTPAGVPAIPGSSLRGMTRNLVEILAFAKIQPVSREKPFYRTVAPDRMGKEYAARMRVGDGVQAGILMRREDHSWEIRPCEVLRVRRDQIGPDTHDRSYPRWECQHNECWVQHDGENVQQFSFKDPQGAEWARATLVLTGHVQNKKREFVFLDPATDGAPIPVPEEIWNRFHDAEQITQWQEKAFPKDKPEKRARRAKGHLRDGEPVFYVIRNRAGPGAPTKELVFLGRAGMFRFPYDLSPADLVPQGLSEAGLDLAEALFGRVSEQGAIKGRVFFEDAMATTEASEEPFEKPLVPQILSAPKATTFQHYLTQDRKEGKDSLTSYLKGDYTAVRGHKLYWHRWNPSEGVSQIKERENHDQKLRSLLEGDNTDTSTSQHTVIQPAKVGTRFSGRIRFENLTEIELGALLSALQLPIGCAHKLGMGKPLGLGSVRLKTRLQVIDRKGRYSAWAPTGATEQDGEQERAAFTKAILEHARGSNETMLEGDDGLWSIARLDALRQLLQWKDRPDRKATAYMGLKEFRNRPVLPTPHAVAGKEEPSWPVDVPRASNGDAGARSQRCRDPRLPVVNDKVRAILTERKEKRGGKVSWRAMHCDSGRTGPLVNSADVPQDKKEGDEVELFVRSLRGGSRSEAMFSWPSKEEVERVAKAKGKSANPRRRRRR